LWFARSAWRTHGLHESSMGVGSKMPSGPSLDPNSPDSVPNASQSGLDPSTDNRPKSGQMLNSPARPALRFRIGVLQTSLRNNGSSSPGRDRAPEDDKGQPNPTITDH
jgi:hypothetical protein